ncbi:nitrate- and nitrite sensing domain-containing protein [Saccharomonospora xinjiangensis]|uniref:sensor histidine kinase n=1 Tax=Saccharomonospora xinjiangensis TaxID=75294 RepID=UPI0010705945|nr:nitrate- and nitrite sensing domain-containing protein [Saccharomonospora xinjiangensis]QBQ62152.1 sensory histidine kinase CreC [Saccharomonospora xinjiangensis]
MTRRGERPPRDGAAIAGNTGGRWRIRHWRLRTKLLVMLLIPSVAVLVLVTLRATDDLDRAATFSESAERIRVETAVAEAVHHLQRERDLTVRFVAGGRKEPLTELREQRAKVDSAVGAFDKALGESEHALSRESIGSFERIAGQFDSLTGLRYAGENTDLPSDAVLRSYSELISDVLGVGEVFVSDAADRELAGSRLAANALARVKDQMSVRRAVVAQALARGEITKDTERTLLATEAELAAAKDAFFTFATPQQQRMYSDTVIGLVVDLGNGIVESVLTRAENGGDLAGLSADEWDSASTYTVNLVKEVQEALLVQLQERSDALAADARRSAGTDAGVVLGALLFAAILAVIITRSLLRPLKALRSSALDVAENKLPAAVDDILTEEHPTPEHMVTRAVEPVPVHTRDELGEVARAFDAVHGEAVRLAGEQAMLRENVNSMFVNLSRRSQDLVERQLVVLDRMEEHEQDPEILGGLYELDHLATRMRRNSENLLVLAGEDAGRPLPGSVPASEIIGAALSEVEHYQRIAVETPPMLSVRGDAAADLIHVIAELFENATAYSPEHEPVTVAGSVTRERQWRIEIFDRGAGMPELEIERANARLAEPPDVDVEVSRRMGLYVVGRLARRHSIEVRLAAAEPRGLMATVLVPADLVEPDTPESIELPVPSEREPEPFAVEPDADGAETAMGASAGEPAATWVSDEVLDDVSDEDEDEYRDEYPGEYPDDYDNYDNYDDYDAYDDEYDDVDPEPAEPGETSDFERTRDLGGAWDPAGPLAALPPAALSPRRTTIELGAQPAWPTEDDDARYAPALEEEVPTDRLPAYQAVLSQWFPDEQDPGAEDVHWPGEFEERASHDTGYGGEDADAVRDVEDIEDVEADAERTEPTPVVPSSIASALSAEDDDTVPKPHPPGHGAVDRRGERPPPVNRSPEAVRARMTSLQHGVRKGRHARGE